MVIALIFGNGVEIPDNTVKVVELAVSKVCDEVKTDGIEFWYLKITFRFGTTELSKEILLTQGKGGYANAQTPREKLFNEFQNSAFPEIRREALATYLLEMLKKGESIRTQHVLTRIYYIFGIKTK